MEPASSPNRRRFAVALLAACVLVTAGAGAATGTPRAGESPKLAAARGRLAAARTRAEAAAHEYEHAHAELARIDDEIEQVEAKLPLVRARSDAARHELRSRAAELYKRGTAKPIVTLEVLGSRNLLGAARVERLARAADSHDMRGIDELDAQARAWKGYRGELARRRERQAAVTELIAASSAELDQAMADAAEAVREIEQEEAVAAFLRAVAAAGPAAEPPPEPAAPRRPAALPEDRDGLDELVPVDQLRCPVDGPVVFTNDWGNPRPNWRVHQGTDMFAARGTPDVAVADGLLRKRTGGIGGNAVWLEADEGTHYYYAHLDDFEGTFAADGTRRVRQGEVVGYTGSTGNAAGGPAHTHFEVHPGGGAAVNPYRMLLVMCAEELGEEPADAEGS